MSWEKKPPPKVVILAPDEERPEAKMCLEGASFATACSRPVSFANSEGVPAGMEDFHESDAGSERVAISFTAPPKKSVSFGSEAENEYIPPFKEPAQPIFGYMYKKCPDVFRIKAWDWRFFVVADMKMAWWSNHANLTASGSRLSTERISQVLGSDYAESNRRGIINFYLSGCCAEADSTNPNVFTVRPKGSWAEGATSDKNQDSSRVYIFDTTKSEHSRDRWVQIIRQHIAEAEAGRDDNPRGHEDGPGGSEFWQDETISPDQAAAAARLVAKLRMKQGRRR